MNMIVNSLPTRTWNRLGMNEALVKLEGVFETAVPAVSCEDEHGTWNPAAEACPQGAQADLLPMMEGRPVGLAETKAGEKMEKPLVLRYGPETCSKSAAHVVLHAAEGSHMKAVILLSASRSGEEETCLQTEVYVDDHAELELYVVQLLGKNGTCVNHIGGICGENAGFDLTRLELGAGKLYSGVNMDLRGKESSFHSQIGYHARPGQVLDMNYVALHHGQKTSSLMEINGTLEEGSRKVFRGTIDFRKGCAGAKGTENENVLLFGDDLVNQTLPVILCREEDVEGNHGASIGQLDEKVLFYLGSRGIGEAQAREMIAEARIEAICAQIPEEAIRDQVREFEHTRGISHGERL